MPSLRLQQEQVSDDKLDDGKRQEIQGNEDASGTEGKLIRNLLMRRSGD